jgi:outer membrane receptor protein involved in Fe transport
VSISLIILISINSLYAQKKGIGSIKGYIIEKTTDKPLEFANVVIKNKIDSAYIQGMVTDKEGRFEFMELPYGEYRIVYSFIGFDETKSAVFVLDAKQSSIDIGKLYISESFTAVNEVQVTTQKSTYVNSIDRKTFNVGQDMMSKSGSVSDIMQNIPSVQVDVDGNVSLRGSENVTILINGRSSAMMNLNRAAALQQLPANSIDKIEIITNPSAKYKPDGTSGIINIVLKKDKGLGLNGNLTANVGNDNRRNFNVMANYNPGKLNLFGSFGIRQDDRTRINNMTTNTYKDLQLENSSKTYGIGHARPIYNLANAGIDYKLNDHNKVGVSANYNYRFQRQNDVSTYTLLDNQGNTIEDYDRVRYLPEAESDLEITSTYQHLFDKEGHELNVSCIFSRSMEKEDNYYTNTYRAPFPIVRYDDMFYHHVNKGSELTVEYTLPISANSKFESGYLLEYFSNDLDLFRDTLDLATNSWNKDFMRSNRFIRSEYTHVLYATFEKEIGKFGLLAGIRGEQTNTRANLVTLDSIIPKQYTRLYPTLHLSYKLTGKQELQLNYSHRIRRPEDEELNPFAEYQDLKNIRVGNPNLKPEDIHSLELGYQFKENSTTFISTLYYRYNQNGITPITRSIGNGVLQSTLENLSQNQSAGLELILSGSLGKIATANLSTNTFYNTIDASSLGYSKNKSIISMSANASMGFNLTKSTVWQLTTNYSSESLTPQGRRLPSFVMNSGLKQELFKNKAGLILTVSDIFNTLRSNYILDTPEIYRHEIRRRTARMIYFGFTYSFGNSTKKQKDSAIKFDNQL